MKFARYIMVLGLIAIVGTFTSAVQGQGSSTKGSSKKGSNTKQDSKPAEKQEGQTQEKKEGKGSAKKEDAPEPITFKVADNNIQFTASGTWKKVQPKSRMLAAEFAIGKIGDDTENGRLTIMGAGGTIEANVVRWQGQFTQPDGSSTAKKSKVETKVIAGQTVTMVDISGTYLDSVGGPMSGKKVERANYRMLAAIIQTENNGNYFVKLYGPKATIDKNEEHFKSMINSVKVAQ